jgi:hypothetical protein
MTARDLRLDYFRIYDIENSAAKGVILTKGQFDRSAKKAQLQVLDFFAACTMKNKEPLFDRYAHLTWYRLLQGTAEPTRMVTVRNQFGDANLWIGRVEALLCPAQKIESGSEPPRQLDHFKVYRVVDYGKPPNVTVALRDQFGSEKTSVLIPDFFAVPVSKTADRQQFPVLNPETHLVIYRTSEKRLEKRTSARDQFGKWPLQLIRGVALAVPSLKLRWK